MSDRAYWISWYDLPEQESERKKYLDWAHGTYIPKIMQQPGVLWGAHYASLPNIMKARKKPIDNKKPSDYGVDPTPRLVTLKVEEPPKRKAGQKVKDVAELVGKLKTEAKVI